MSRRDQPGGSRRESDRSRDSYQNSRGNSRRGGARGGRGRGGASAPPQNNNNSANAPMAATTMQPTGVIQQQPPQNPNYGFQNAPMFQQQQQQPFPQQQQQHLGFAPGFGYPGGMIPPYNPGYGGFGPPQMNAAFGGFPPMNPMQGWGQQGALPAPPTSSIVEVPQAEPEAMQVDEDTPRQNNQRDRRPRQRSRDHRSRRRSSSSEEEEDRDEDGYRPSRRNLDRTRQRLQRRHQEEEEYDGYLSADVLRQTKAHRSKGRKGKGRGRMTPSPERSLTPTMVSTKGARIAPLTAASIERSAEPRADARELNQRIELGRLELQQVIGAISGDRPEVANRYRQLLQGHDANVLVSAMADDLARLRRDRDALALENERLTERKRSAPIDDEDLQPPSSPTTPSTAGGSATSRERRVAPMPQRTSHGSTPSEGRAPPQAGPSRTRRESPARRPEAGPSQRPQPLPQRRDDVPPSYEKAVEPPKKKVKPSKPKPTGPVTYHLPGILPGPPPLLLDDTPEEMPSYPIIRDDDDDSFGDDDEEKEDESTAENSRELREMKARNKRIDREARVQDEQHRLNEQRRQREWPGRVHNAIGVIRNPQTNRLERNNFFFGMLPEQFYWSERTNSVYYGDTALDAITFESRNPGPFRPPYDRRLYIRVPNGFPMNPQEVLHLLNIIHGREKKATRLDRAEAYLLLYQFQSTALDIDQRYWDRAMTEVMRSGLFGQGDMPFHRSDRVFRSPRLPIDERALSRNRSTATRGAGLPPPQPTEAFNIDLHAQYMLHHGRPMSENPYTGIVFDRAFRVHRRSVFGYLLGTVLAPDSTQGRANFMRLFASICARPRFYLDQIAAWDLAHPTNLYAPIPAGAPQITITRMADPGLGAPNMTDMDVVHVLITNRIPVRWIDHAYVWGLHWLDHHISGFTIHANLFDHIDNERIQRLMQWGVPTPIPGWSGWYHPTRDDLTRLRVLIPAEEARGFTSLADRRWLRYGASPFITNLHNRPPFTLPPRTPAVTAGSSTSDVTAPPTDNSVADADMAEPTTTAEPTSSVGSNDSSSTTVVPDVATLSLTAAPGPPMAPVPPPQDEQDADAPMEGDEPPSPH